MVNAAEQWVKEYGEASKLAEEVNKLLAERASLPPSGPETQRFLSGLHRRITILGTRLGKLEVDLASLPRKAISDKEMHKRQDMLSNLRAKEKQMASALNMSYAADREDLLGPSKGPVDEVKRAAGLDNQGIVSLQRQIMRGYLGPACGSYRFTPSEGAKETCNFEQKKQSRLFLHVPSIVCPCHCNFGSHRLDASEVLVKSSLGKYICP